MDMGPAVREVVVHGPVLADAAASALLADAAHPPMLTDATATIVQHVPQPMCSQMPSQLLAPAAPPPVLADAAATTLVLAFTAPPPVLEDTAGRRTRGRDVSW